MSIKIKSLVFLILVVFISSCGDSDEESPSSRLKGTWSLVAYDIDVTSSVTSDDFEINTSSSISASDISYFITFGDSDYTTEGGYTVTSVIDVDGFEETITTTISDINVSGTYTSTNTEVIFSDGLISLELDGIPQSSMNQSLEAISYEIDANGDLLFTQNERNSVTQQGVTSASTIDLTARFERN